MEWSAKTGVYLRFCGAGAKIGSGLYNKYRWKSMLDGRKRSSLLQYKLLSSVGLSSFNGCMELLGRSSLMTHGSARKVELGIRRPFKNIKKFQSCDLI